MTVSTISIGQNLSAVGAGAVPVSCLGQGCTAFSYTLSSTKTSAAASSFGVNGTTVASSISTYTSTLTSLTSGSVGLPGSASASAAVASETITTDAATSTLFETFTSIATRSVACTGGHACLSTYTIPLQNSSSTGSTTAGATGTANITTTPAGTTVTMLPSTNGSWSATSLSSNISYSSTYSTAAGSVASPPSTQTPVTATSSNSLNASAINQSSASASTSVPHYTNATNPGIWPEWTQPAQFPGGTPTTFATSLTSSNSTGASPTGGSSGLNSTGLLSKVKVDMAELAGDSVGVIEKIDSLLADL
jgi:hypothetical protein